MRQKYDWLRNEDYKVLSIVSEDPDCRSELPGSNCKRRNLLSYTIP